MHSDLASIHSKNWIFWLFGLESKFWSYLTQGRRNFWNIFQIEEFSSIVKKCTFTVFSTFIKILLVKFYCFRCRSHICGWKCKPFSYPFKTIKELPFVPFRLHFHPHIRDLLPKKWFAFCNFLLEILFSGYI